MARTSVTAELLARARDGDRVALDALVSRFELRLRRFLRRRLPDDGAALGLSVDDLYQDIQLEATRSLPRFTYRHDGSYLAWLYTIARRRLGRELERSHRQVRPVVRYEGGRTTEHLLAGLVAPPDTPDQQLERLEQIDQLAEALAELPEQRRRALILVYFEGLDGSEAAAELGLGSDAFRACLSRARRQLAAILDAESSATH